MSDEIIRIPLADDRDVSAVLTPPSGPESGWTFIYAPGAGSNLHDRFGAHVAATLAERGVSSVRFQFPYMEERKRRPDSPRLLEATWRAVIESSREKAAKLAVGGRSMGGRIASQVVAQGVEVDALVLFAYPLHPPGNPSKMRDAHLPEIGVPTLFCSGTRDDFGSPRELEQASATVPRHQLHLLEGADHGFKTLKASSRSQKDVWDEATDVFAEWLDSL